MDVLFWLLILFLAIFVASKLQSSKKREDGSSWVPAPTLADKSQRVGENDLWRRDPATEKQLDYIVSLGGKVPKGHLSKGEASAIIDGLLPPDDQDLAVLRFFKVPTKGLREKTAAEAAQK